MPYYRLFLLLLCLFVSAPFLQAQQMPRLSPNYLELPAGSHTLSFIWQGDSLQPADPGQPARWEPHAAMLIPVQLPGSARIFYLQFDTGSPSTVLYREELTALHSLYPKVQWPSLQGDTAITVQFKAGDMTIKAPRLPLLSLTRPAAADGHSQPHIIGTFGSDLLDNKVVVIDYPGQHLQIFDELPASYTHIPLHPFQYTMRRILLPAVLHGQQKWLYFDSGSSAFELLTNKATCYQFSSDTTQINRYVVQSWNNQLTACTLPAIDSLQAGGKQLSIHSFSFIEGVTETQVAAMMKMGIGGMIGNKLLICQKLLLDTKNKRFGLL